MNEIINNINLAKFDFVGPLAFVMVMLVGILVGFLNGLKTTLFFFVLNIFCIAGAIMAFYYSKEIAEAIISDDYTINSKRIFDLAKDNNAGVKNIVGVLTGLTIYGGMNLVFFLPLYFFFRKSLKDSIWENKQLKTSNLKYRFGGSMVGLVTSFPVAVLVAVLVTPFGSSASGFVSFIADTSEIIFAKQVHNIPQSIYDLANTLKL